MRKTAVATIILFGLSLFFSLGLYAQDPDKTAKKLSAQLQKEVGLTESERKSIDKPVREMLREGAGKEDIKNAVSGLAKGGIRGEELKSSVNSMNEMVRRGSGATEAGNIVSQAAHQAKSEGLKGKDLANRVHEAARKMQAEKRQKQEMKREEKHKTQMDRPEEMREHKSGMEHRGPEGGRGHGSAGGRR